MIVIVLPVIAGSISSHEATTNASASMRWSWHLCPWWSRPMPKVDPEDDGVVDLPEGLSLVSVQFEGIRTLVGSCLV